MGHEVIVKKIPFKNTGLGRVLQSKKKMSALEFNSADSEGTAIAAQKLLDVVQPDLTFQFHCTENSSSNERKLWQGDYWKILPGQLEIPRAFIVEVKAPFGKLPKSIRSKIKNNFTHWRGWGLSELLAGAEVHKGGWLRKTTKASEAKRIGYHPQLFAQELVKVINPMANQKWHATIGKLPIGGKIAPQPQKSQVRLYKFSKLRRKI